MHLLDFVALIFNDFLKILLIFVNFCQFRGCRGNIVFVYTPFFKIKIKIVFGDLQPKHFKVITFNN